MNRDWDSQMQTLLKVLAILFFILVGSVLIVVGSAHAKTCLSMDVQPSQVLGNYDGDTFTVSFGGLGNANIRVEGIDTPERNKKQPGWKEAKEFTAAWLARGPFKLNTCLVLTLGRIAASPSRDGVTLADALRTAGHAKPR